MSQSIALPDKPALEPPDTGCGFMGLFCPEQGVVEGITLSSETSSVLRMRLLVLCLLFLGAVCLFVFRGVVFSTTISPEQAVASLALLGCAAILSSDLSLSYSQLRALEMIVFGTLVLHLTIINYVSVGDLVETSGSAAAVVTLYRIATGFFGIIVGYGIFIPNTWMRALAVTGTTAVIGATLGVYSWYFDPRLAPIADPVEAAEHLSYTGALVAIGVIASVLGAHLVHSARTNEAQARALGLYQLEEQIGSGGMGEVWRASHHFLARPAAIKMIRPEMLTTRDPREVELVMERFQREARATAQLQSPHTVQLYDFGVTSEGAFYYVMEHLSGLDLEQLVRRFGPVPQERAVHFLKQAAESLDEAHSAGLIHRDIKPSNLFVTSLAGRKDFLKILDFGLVKIQTDAGADDEHLTREGITTGTPAFMAPETAMHQGQESPQSDVYSLGCVAYWLLAGRLVFDADSPLAMVVEHARTEAVPPSQRTETPVSAKLDQLILDCLEKSPSDRPLGASDLLRRLEEIEDENHWTQTQAQKWWQFHSPTQVA